MRGSLNDALSAHLSDADVAVPVRDRAVRGEGFEADAFQAIDRRDDDWQRRAVQRKDIGAVERMMARIVFARTPGVEFRLGRGVERGRQGDDRADIQIDVRPPVQPPADAARERVVDGRVAERAGDADARQLPARSTLPRTPTTALSRSSSTVTAGSFRSTSPALQRGDDLARQRFDVDLETDGERRRRWNGREDLVHPQHVGPQLLVAERVVAEDALPESMSSGAIVLTARCSTVKSCADCCAAAEGPDEEAANASATTNTIEAAPMSRMADHSFAPANGFRTRELDAPRSRFVPGRDCAVTWLQRAG